MQGHIFVKGWSVMYMFVFQPIANDYDTLILALVFDCILINVWQNYSLLEQTIDILIK